MMKRMKRTKRIRRLKKTRRIKVEMMMMVLTDQVMVIKITRPPLNYHMSQSR